MSFFNCCKCPEPDDYDPEVDDPLPTYVNLCGCPTVNIECASEEKHAKLCGWEEASNFVSSPPKKYKALTLSVSGVSTSSFTPFNCGQMVFRRDTLSGSISYSVNPSLADPDCSASNDDGELISTRETYDCLPDEEGNFSPTLTGTQDLTCRDGQDTTPGFDDWFVLFNQASATSVSRSGTGDVCGANSNTGDDSRTEERTLDSEDTESAAIDRETATAGTLCTSIYELRTTSFSFTHRTVEYTATARNLVVGVEYEGCIRLQRREAYSGVEPVGADTDWYDVEPDPIVAFTATDTEKEVATDVELPLAQGWEYRIVGGYVWPTSANCDCPTSYEAPEE